MSTIVREPRRWNGTGCSLAAIVAVWLTLAGTGCAVDPAGGSAAPAPDGGNDSGIDAPAAVDLARTPDAPAPDPTPAPGTFRFAVISDTHIIDDYYVGPEGNALDTETVYQTSTNLAAARDALAALPDRPDFVLVAGDVFHNYPSTDPAFYDTHLTRIDRAADLLRSFPMPVHPAWGNHDHDEPSIPRSLTVALIRRSFGVDLYSSFDHQGWTFLLLDAMLGDTQDDASPVHDSSVGSLGTEQLHWVQAQLARGRPTVVVVHFPLFQMAEEEGGEPGLPALLRAHADNVRMVFSGHLHMWIDDTGSGVPHLVMSSTRYDPDAYAVAEADGATGEVRVLNRDCFTWLGFDTQPWDPVKGCTPAP